MILFDVSPFILTDIIVYIYSILVLLIHKPTKGLTQTFKIINSTSLFNSYSDLQSFLALVPIFVACILPLVLSCLMYMYVHVKKLKKKFETCTLLIPKVNSYCRRKSSARGPRPKVSSKGLSAEIDIPLR